MASMARYSRTEFPSHFQMVVLIERLYPGLDAYTKIHACAGSVSRGGFNRLKQLSAFHHQPRYRPFLRRARPSVVPFR